MTVIALPLARSSRALVLATILSSWGAFSQTAIAQEESRGKEVIVTASRLDTTEENVGSSVTIITAEQLEQGQYRNVAQALRQVAGVDLVQSGGFGGNTAAFIRGANSEHTLVLLDGIELNNPASTNRAFNLANLTLDNIERIEVLRGPQSTIYGSDALGGVISIITKKAKEGVAASASSEAGSYNSFTQTGSLAYGAEAVDVTAGITRQDIGNISAADARDGNKENDDYDNTSFTSRVGIKPSEMVSGAVTTRYTRANIALDNSGGVGGDDPNRRLRNEEFFTRGEGATSFLDGKLSQTVGFSYTNHGLDDNNDPDEFNQDFQRSSFNGDLQRFDIQNKWDVAEWFSFVTGAQTERERASSAFFLDSAFGPYEDNLLGRSARTNTYFIESRASAGKYAFIDAGVRYDDHSIFGSATTFRIAPAIIPVEGTKLRGSVGTGYKAPSLVQLYSSFGNPILDPEESVGWDVGLDQTVVEDYASVSLTYFRNELDNLIQFNPATFVLDNIANAETRGLEFASTITPTPQLEIRSSYTYTDSLDEQAGTSLLRRPRNKAAITVSYSPTDALKLSVQTRMFGTRFDNDFSGATPQRVALGGYSLFDLAGSYKICDNAELFTRVENLFDKEYQEVLGFGTMGLAGYGGIKISL